MRRLVAWDATEKNLGGLGGSDSETYTETKRTILVTPPVAKALSALYRSKEALAGDLECNARRPMLMRAFAYYYADTDGVLSAGKSFAEVYSRITVTGRLKVLKVGPQNDPVTIPCLVDADISWDSK